MTNLYMSTLIVTIQCQSWKSYLSLLTSKEVFDADSPPDQEALRNSRQSVDLTYSPVKQSRDKRSRKRRIIYFNYLFSRNVRSNIGGDFLKLTRKHFSKSSPLTKIINTNTIEISYSCMPHLNKKISQHNKKISQPTPIQPSKIATVQKLLVIAS